MFNSLSLYVHYFAILDFLILKFIFLHVLIQKIVKQQLRGLRSPRTKFFTLIIHIFNFIFFYHLVIIYAGPLLNSSQWLIELPCLNIIDLN